MRMTKEAATDFFAELYHGEHHSPGKLKEWGDGWAMNHFGDCSTFNFDFMTRLVFLAHDRCVRAKISQGGPRAIRIAIWQRAGREGSMFQRHPTIDQALASWRQRHPEETVVKEVKE